jgi:hypothetical protein
MKPSEQYKPTRYEQSVVANFGNATIFTLYAKAYRAPIILFPRS